jgi:hypothetical protein
LALVGPPILGALVARRYEINEWKFESAILIYAVFQIVALSAIFHAMTCSLWLKCLSVVPYLALSLFATGYLILLFAAASGNPIM